MGTREGRFFPVRAYAPADRESVLALFDSNAPQFFSPAERKDFEAALDNPKRNGPYYVVTDPQGRIVGVGGISLDHPSPNVATLCWGMVARDAHRRGIGSRLLHARLSWLWHEHPRVREVRVNTSQHSAKFFSRHDFTTTKVVKDGYGPGLDRHEMSRSW